MTHGGLNCDHMEPTVPTYHTYTTHQLSHTNTTHQLSHINTTHKLPHTNITHINSFENIRTILNRFHPKYEEILYVLIIYESNVSVIVETY